MELLAPVGSQKALVAAVESGANAVYLAGKLFGARAYADNFNEEELAEAVKLAHLRGVLVYVTVNTLVDNQEIQDLISYMQYLDRIHVDAIIVQDIGVADIARQVIPSMPLHASTQMTIHNLDGVLFLAKNGFSRAVLARELSLEDIRYICRYSPIEIEIFIHGALCISYSGQCLMSSIIGGRSGNRGRCAQPCRLPYTLVDKQGCNALDDQDAGEYLLSPKDLNTIDSIPELLSAGVTSLKIEGRMKRPEYVAVVVDTYRRSLDACLAGNGKRASSLGDHKNLAQVFNRDFTTAYLYKHSGREMISHRRPNNRGVRIGRVLEYRANSKTAVIRLDEPLYKGDIIEFWVKVGGRVNITVNSMSIDGEPVLEAPANTAVAVPVPSPVKSNDRVFKVFDARLMEYARKFFAGVAPVRRIPVKVLVEVAVGEPLRICIEDTDGYTGQAATHFIAEKARNRPLTAETISRQIERMGNTVFAVQSLNCQIQGEVMVPVSEINDARRRAIDGLEQARLDRFIRSREKSVVLPRIAGPVIREKKRMMPQLTVHVDSVEKVKQALDHGADVILFGGETMNHRMIPTDEYRKVVDMVRTKEKKIILSTPRLVKEWQVDKIKKELTLFGQLTPDAVAVSNLGVLHMARELTDIPLHGDYPLNIYNWAAIKFLQEQGLDSITLSPELNFSQVEEIVSLSTLPVECLVHGYLTLMISEYCMLGSFLGNLHAGSCSQACLKGTYWLKDRKEEIFPVVTDQFCRMHILNAKELSMLPYIYRFYEMGIDRIRIEGKNDRPVQLGRLVRLYRECLEQERDSSDRLQDKINQLEHENITRGHYFRGVL
ncbi:hypothetical protein P22_2290 [Propionispora sp. 2/2-37]|nr:hypothetical protein P22_2290 [Propionispora sp. 2/2-37]